MDTVIITPQNCPGDVGRLLHRVHRIPFWVAATAFAAL